MLFVGGLDQQVNEEVLHAAFIPFGVIKEVQIPRDFQKSKICTILFMFMAYGDYIEFLSFTYRYT